MRQALHSSHQSTRTRPARLLKKRQKADRGCNHCHHLAGRQLQPCHQLFVFSLFNSAAQHRTVTPELSCRAHGPRLFSNHSATRVYRLEASISWCLRQWPLYAVVLSQRLPQHNFLTSSWDMSRHSSTPVDRLVTKSEPPPWRLVQCERQLCRGAIFEPRLKQSCCPFTMRLSSVRSTRDSYSSTEPSEEVSTTTS